MNREMFSELKWTYMITTERVLCCNFQLEAQLDKLGELWQQHPNEEFGLSLGLSFIQVMEMEWKVMKMES